MPDFQNEFNQKKKKTKRHINRHYEKDILGYLSMYDEISDKDYKTFTNRANSTRAKDFKTLVTNGMIIRKGRGKAIYYILGESLPTSC